LEATVIGLTELIAKGIHTDAENYGGPTVEGIVFIAATADNKFRTYNKIMDGCCREIGLPVRGF